MSRAIERAARDSRSRLIAFLAARSRDVAAAEDALADAFHAALVTWPRDGVPDNPEAWLLVAARRRMIDAGRAARTHAEAAPTLLALTDEATAIASTGVAFPDERLKLLFICAHPVIDRAARTPLMLQVVLGLDAARIASAFLVKPSAMGQRLSRAKAKIRDAGVAFELPETKQLPTRVDAVLEAIYAAYGSGWDDVEGADARKRGLAEEAIELGRLLLHLLPENPEARALFALMLYCESRRDARRDAEGAYVPLSEQDVARWSHDTIAEAEVHLIAAREANRIGRFQLEAAIQSVHARRAMTGRTDWEAIAILYEGLIAVAPTTGAMVGRAAAVAEARDAPTAWALLHEIEDEAVATYQPYWALAAHLAQRTGRSEEAAQAYTRAIGLCEERATREFLMRQAAGK